MRSTLVDLSPRPAVEPSARRSDRRSFALIGAIVIGLHLAGFGLLITAIHGHFMINSTTAFGFGLGLTAYTLGMRHAFDADHIAAIDNTTRKLVSEQKRPLTVGLWFSLGHSSVVFVMCVLLSLGVKAVIQQVGDGGSTLQSVAGVVGTAVSGTFLLVIGIVNLIVLAQLLGLARRFRADDAGERELEAHLRQRGALIRVIGRALQVVRRPGHMFGVGFLFGLGFDTATEITLLVIAGGAAAVSLPWYAILTLPLLFAAGMSLMDSLDGVMMRFAYGWAQHRPMRRIFYNIVVTAMSVAISLMIGGIELIGLLAEKIGIRTGPFAWIASVDLDNAGFYIVGLLAFTWVAALLVWKIGRLEERRS